LISDLDIYRAAKLLIDQHGEDAPIRAAQRADELLQDGDTEGAAIWRAIMSAIEELQRGRHEGEPAELKCGLTQRSAAARVAHLMV
jgi:hypothetical protein